MCKLDQLISRYYTKELEKAPGKTVYDLLHGSAVTFYSRIIRRAVC